MSQSCRSRYWPGIVLALIFVAFSSSTAIWIGKDKTPPVWDPADHINTAFDYYSTLKNGGLTGFLSEFFLSPHHYAPVFHLMMGSNFLLFGPSIVAARLTNLVSLALLLISTYGIGKRLYDRSAGLLAALVGSSYHMSAAFIHEAFIDYTLLAFVSLSFWMLIRAEDFHSRKWATVFGAALGLGMLVKQTFIFFFWLPLAAQFAYLLRRKDSPALINFSWALVIGGAIAAVWYVPHLKETLEIYRVNRAAAIGEGDPPVLSFYSIFAYLYAMANYQVQPLFFLLFIAGLILSLRRHRRQNRILYLWLLSAYLAFTAQPNKDPRYTLPLLTAAALLTAYLAYTINAPGRRMAAYLLIAGCSIVSFFTTQWPIDNGGEPRTGLSRSATVALQALSRNVDHIDQGPQSRDWSLGSIAEAIADYSEKPHTVVGIADNEPLFNPSTFGVYFRLLRKEKAESVLQARGIEEGEWQRQINRCDFIVTKAGNIRESNQTAASHRLASLIAGAPDCIRLAAFSLPDGTSAVVYKVGRDSPLK